MRVLRKFRWRSDRGSTLIEFTFVCFMLIIMLLGVVEMGRLLLVYTTLAKSARAGARYAIVHGAYRTGSGVNGASGPGNVAQVQTVVKNLAGAGLLNTASLTVAVAYPNGTNTAGSPVKVTVSYTYDPLIPYFNSLLSTAMGSTSEGVITF